jgi:periplasmic divalent cation tolerance protein
MVTAASQGEAERIARLLVESHLAAGVNMLPIHSIYRWQGEIHSEPEYQLLIQTTSTKFDRLCDRVCSVHSYQVPEIIAIPLSDGYPPYLNWIATETNSEEI